MLTIVHIVTYCTLHPQHSLILEKFVPFDHLLSIPLASTFHFYKSDLFLCFHLFVWAFLIPPLPETIQYLPFSVWFILLTIMPLRSIHHIVVNSRISSFFSGWIIYCNYIPQLFIHTTTPHPFIHLWTLKLFLCLSYCK